MYNLNEKKFYHKMDYLKFLIVDCFKIMYYVIISIRIICEINFLTGAINYLLLSVYCLAIRKHYLKMVCAEDLPTYTLW